MLIFNVVFALTEKIKKKSSQSAVWSEGLLKCNLGPQGKASLYDSTGTRVDCFPLSSNACFSLQSQLQSNRFSIILESAHNAQAQVLLDQSKLDTTSSSSSISNTNINTNYLNTSAPQSSRPLHQIPLKRTTSNLDTFTLGSSLINLEHQIKKRNLLPEIKCIKSFSVMYTDQKLKKAKTWKDGFGKWLENGKWILYDSNHKSIDSFFLKDRPKVGDDLELDRYLVTIESEEQGSSNEATQPTEQDETVPSVVTSSASKLTEGNSIDSSSSASSSLSSSPSINSTTLSGTYAFLPKQKQFSVPFLNTSSSSSHSSKPSSTSLSSSSLLSSSATTNVNLNSTSTFARTRRLNKVTVPESLSSLAFCPTPSRRCIRHFRIPNTFASLAHYQSSFRFALLEHLQVQLSEMANTFETLTSSKSIKSSLHQRLSSQSSIPFYDHCTLSKLSTSRYLLHLSQPSQTDLSMDDIWALCPTIGFQKGVVLCRATGYGNIHIELSPFSSFPSISTDEQFYALRVLSNCHDLTLLDYLETINEEHWPLLPLLLEPQPFIQSPPSSSSLLSSSFPEKNDVSIEEARSIALNLSNHYKLNPVQQNVVLHVAENLVSESSSITLVHGVFGSGKSHLASVLVLLQQNLTPYFPVLISSLTNAAVDRILTCLVDKDFHSFTRFGNSKKVHASIKPYFLSHSSSSPNTSTFSSSASTSNNFTSSSSIQSVVGATCLATLLSIMDGSYFPIVILDEASQLTEPMALLPLRFNAQHVIILGDPCQLSPTISGTCFHEDHLEKTLFHRCCLRISPFFMNIQYRCPPTFSLLATELFYPKGIENGPRTIPSTDIFIPNLPCLIFIEVPRSQEQRQGASFINSIEAQLILDLCQRLPQANQCAVISLYRAQAFHIQQHLLRLQSSSSHKAVNKKRLVSSNSNSRSKHQLTGSLNYHENDFMQVSQNHLDEQEEELSEDPVDSVMKSATVDAFQGTEKDVVMVSTVRSSSSTDFLGDPKRLNVLLTRAKHHLIIFGKQSILNQQPLWASILKQCSILSFKSLLTYFPSRTSSSETIPALFAAASSFSGTHDPHATTTTPSSSRANDPLGSISPYSSVSKLPSSLDYSDSIRSSAMNDQPPKRKKENSKPILLDMNALVPFSNTMFITGTDPFPNPLSPVTESISELENDLPEKWADLRALFFS